MTRLSLFDSPLLLGFERFERIIDLASKASAEGYPPYNIEQVDQNRLRITVALAEASFIGDDVAAGRLARPFDLAVDIDGAYYIVCPPGALDRPKVRAFRDWLVEEAAAHRVATAAAAA